MSLFSSKKSTERFGVVIDLGSGSAMVALVASSETEAAPTILWSTREIASLREIENLHESSKSVITALVNALLMFETEGRQALEKYRPGAKIKTVQCSIAAPWSYTITKQIQYRQDDTFEVTDDLIAELTRTAKAKTEESLKEREITSELGLTVASRATLHTIMNGYPVRQPIGKETNELNLVQTSVVVHAYLLDSLEDIRRKVFPGIQMEVLTYSLLLHCVAKDMYPTLPSIALVDVTYEATEITVVRENMLSYVTHTPFGIYSLARELSAITAAPLSESYQHLISLDFEAYTESLPETKQKEVETLLLNYTNKLQELLMETGDELAAPRHLALHTEAGAEGLFTDLLSNAAKKASHVSPVISSLTSALVKKFSQNEKNTALTDTAMLVGADFFHNGKHCVTIEHTH